jgi:hypothetical protein
MVSDFEEFMAPRLEMSQSDEATKVVLELWDGRKLEEAVLDAIESLPARKTKRLRTWVEQATDYSEWKSLERAGWRIPSFSGNTFTVIAPTKNDLRHPPTSVIAIAVNAHKVIFVGPTTKYNPYPAFVYQRLTEVRV